MKANSACTRDALWQINTEAVLDIAWLPDATEPDDSVCLIAGAPWPLSSATIETEPVGFWVMGTYSNILD